MGLGFGFGGFFMVIFWGLLIWAIVALVRGGSSFGSGCCGGHGHMGKGNGDDAMEILKHRYAKGEINKEEFEKMKKDLQ